MKSTISAQLSTFDGKCDKGVTVTNNDGNIRIEISDFNMVTGKWETVSLSEKQFNAIVEHIEEVKVEEVA